MKFIFLDSQGILREAVLPNSEDQISFGLEWHQELRLLSALEVAQQYIKVIDIPIDGSIYFSVESATQLENIDYEIQTVGDECRIVFINQLAAGGISELVEGDLVFFKYAIQNPTDTIQFRKETITLDSVDISNQYIIVSGKPVGFIEKIIAPGITFTAGFDYDLEDVAPNTRIVFKNELLTSGVAALGNGDVLQISYAVNNY